MSDSTIYHDPLKWSQHRCNEELRRLRILMNQTCNLINIARQIAEQVIDKVTEGSDVSDTHFIARGQLSSVLKAALHTLDQI